MIYDQRVLHQTTDISLLVNDYRTGSYTFVYTAGEYVYIGSTFPFNNLWIEVGTPNDVASALSVDMWFGHQWIPAVDLMDGTNGLFNTGRLIWNTNIDKGWDLEQRSADVTGLSTTTIYNMFWARLSWSNTINPLTTLKYFGQKFSDDTALYDEYPDFQQTQILEAFGAGKTTWDEQHYIAAEQIVSELKKRNVAQARSQLLDYSLFTEASCHKIAEIIYRAFGSPYLDQLKIARDEFKNAMNMKNFGVDLNSDGRLDPAEKRVNVGFGTR